MTVYPFPNIPACRLLPLKIKLSRDSPPVKEVCPMRRFFRDVLVAFVAGLLVAVVAHLMGF